MGLFQKICTEYSTKKEPKDLVIKQGLLAVAQKYNLGPKLPFSIKIDSIFKFFRNLVEEIGLKKISILVPYENFYKPVFSYGLENTSIEKLDSSKDFWEGTITDSEWYSLEGEDLASFYQLFSEIDNQSLAHLHIKKLPIKDSNVIILLLEDCVDSFIDLETVEMIFPELESILENILLLSEKNVLFSENQSTEVLEDRINDYLDNNFQGFCYKISLRKLFFELASFISFEDYYHIFSVIFYITKYLSKEDSLLYFKEDLYILFVSFAQT